MSWEVDGRPIRSLLLTRLRYLGDVVMTTILLEVLRKGAPDLRIGYLCEEGYGEVLADHPALDRLHLLRTVRRGGDAKARQGAAGPLPRTSAGPDLPPAAGTVATVISLRRARYDAAVDLFFNPRSAWLLRLSGAKVRVGGTRRSRRRLYTHTVQRQDVADVAGFAELAPGGLGEHLCRLAPLTHTETGLGLLEWAVRNFPVGSLKPRLGVQVPPSGDRYLVLAPGATWSTKEWPLAAWRQLIGELLADGAPRLKLLLPPGKEAAWHGLTGTWPAPGVEVLARLPLSEVRDLLAEASGLITVDGGVMHMGVAVGTPTVALFGPTDPRIWFPYEGLGPYRVLLTAPACHPCDLHHCGEFICLPELSTAAVQTAAREVFGLALGPVPGEAP